MKPHHIELKQPGVYLFSPLNTVGLQINRQLLVVFYIPQPAACGVILFDPCENRKHLVSMLNALFTELKIKVEKTKALQMKCFGLSSYQPMVLRTLRQWQSKHKLRSCAEDLGKNVVRHIEVNCSRGLVAVSYAERFLPRESYQIAAD